MKCAFCNRPLERAAVLIGEMAVGPVCAERAGLIEKVRRGHGTLRMGPKAKGGRVRMSEDSTMDLFDDGKSKNPKTGI